MKRIFVILFVCIWVTNVFGVIDDPEGRTCTERRIKKRPFIESKPMDNDTIFLLRYKEYEHFIN